jgi:hypothetical protein
MLLAPQIIKDFRDKYRGKRTIISNEIFDGKLAAITTTSALGKSSVYDRIKIPGTSGFEHVGWSRGSGEFQFFNGVYDELFEIALDQAMLSDPSYVFRYLDPLLPLLVPSRGVSIEIIGITHIDFTSTGMPLSSPIFFAAFSIYGSVYRVIRYTR